jgi:hypothetical protein
MEKLTGILHHIITLQLIFSIFPLLGFGQPESYFKDNPVRNENATYRETIQTVLLYKYGFELSPPIIRLNSEEKILLSFDDLDPVHKNYRYTVVHCDAFWNSSSLQQMEYIDGFMEEDIHDYRLSFNTTTPFMNYVAVFPTDYMRLKISGNYILKVYEDNPEEENVILTRKFFVFEPLVDVKLEVNKAMDLNRRYTHQQVDLRIVADNYTITDSYKDLNVLILQNGRWDNPILNAQPRMITGNLYDYTMQQEMAFPGGNEFRYLDMKTLKYNTDRMKQITYDYDGYHVYVMTDEPRNTGSYIFSEDINGRRLITVNQARDPYSEADYAWVHFILPYYPPLADGAFYVSGSFSDWQFSDKNKMTYNFDLRAYEAKLFLKQGYYNYAYAFLENRSLTGDLTLIEGSYWETENEYAALIYHRTQGLYYDRLIGLGFIGGGI